MAFSSVAIIAGAATLAVSLFRDKELRVKDIIALSTLSKNSIETNPHLILVRNDINAHITGVKDPVFHDVLIEIMARHNKPVGYFKKANDRLRYTHPHHITIIKHKRRDVIKRELTSINSSFASFVYIAVVLIILQLAIDLDRSSDMWMQAAAILLGGFGGIIFSHLVLGLAAQWSNNTHNVKDSEYQRLFDEYIDDKKAKSGISESKNEVS